MAKTKYKDLPKSKGILDDFSVRKNVATRAGTITKTPVDDIDIANKKYVDDNAGFTGTEGSIPFVAPAGTLTEDNFNLYWDNAANELQPHHMKIVSDGTQAAPALKFNDTNTGFYKVGDAIKLSINNSTVWASDASGNITVGGTVDGIDIATDVAANTLKISYTDAAVVALNTTHRSSDGSDHSLSHAESHDIASHSDTTATGAELNTLTGGGDTTLHDHDGISENTAARHAQSHNIASHSDTTATGTELNTLTDNSMADALHRHSELSASDGSPDPALQVDAAGNITVGDTSGATSITKSIEIISPGYAGIILSSDALNSGGEPGGGFVKVTQDGGAVVGIMSTIQLTDSDGAGGTFTGTTGNAMLVGNKYAGSLHLGTNNIVRMTISNAGKVTTTADNAAVDTAYMPMVLYNTDATPPAASGFPIGTIYVQYTA